MTLIAGMIEFSEHMRYLVKAKARKDRSRALLEAIDRRTLGRSSVAGGEYLRNMRQARLVGDGSVQWVEVCYCSTPLEEERPYWEEYFQLVSVRNAHSRRRCRDLTGEEPWACSDCDCTEKLEKRLNQRGRPFLGTLRKDQSSPKS